MADTGSATQLSIAEGVLLGHALVARVADGLGIRAFFIKGPTSVIQGLREHKTSADVDVFVEPSSLERILLGLRERGWRERPVDPDIWTFPKHAVTVHHPEWPCCIDVHFRFPGMETAPEECFEVMWASIETIELAGKLVRVPSKELGILILALHALRSPLLAAYRQELEFLTCLTRREAHASAVLDIATRTGSLAAIRPFLVDLLPVTRAEVWPESSSEWRNRIMATEPGTSFIMAMSQAPWQDRLKMLWCAVFPRPEVFLSRNIYADMSLHGRLRQQLVRGMRVVRSAPQILRAIKAPGFEVSHEV